MRLDGYRLGRVDWVQFRCTALLSFYHVLLTARPFGSGAQKPYVVYTHMTSSE
jgi:hypothetical protein